MKRYNFDDFKTDSYIGSAIEYGQYGNKIEISIFNPLVPAHYREKALKAINDFIEEHGKEISIETIRSVSGCLEAYINEEAEVDKKYCCRLYLFNQEGASCII